MKTIASVLLMYTTSVHLIAKFSPIPFIGFTTALLGFPLALKLSLRELFVVELVGIAFSLSLQMDTVLFYFSYGLALTETLPFIFKLLTILSFSIGMAGMSVGMSLFFAILMKLLSRFTPKRIKVVLNET